MHPIFKFILISLSALSALCAQSPDIGFLRVVNAVAPGAGPAAFFVDGRALYAGGYKLGQDTGGYGVKAGNREIVVRKQGLQAGRAQIQIVAGETMTVIAFADPRPSQREQDPPRWEIKLLRLKQQDGERGYGLSFVSVCAGLETPVRVVIDGRSGSESVVARRLAITRCHLGTRQVEARVMIRDRTLTHISTDSPGNYVVILYETAEGVVEALSFYDPKFVIAG
jgi:hypothetical protein